MTEQILYPVKYVSELKDNLFSIMSKPDRWAALSSNGNKNIVVNYKDGRDIIFDWRLNTKDEWVAGINILSHPTELAKVLTRKSQKKILMRNVNKFHVELGHPSEAVTRATGAQWDIKITDTFALYEACGIGKAK